MLREVVLDAQVDVVREGLNNALLEGRLHHVRKVVTGLHAAIEQARVVLL